MMPSEPPTSPSVAATITGRLATVGPFDGAGLMRFFADHAITGVEQGDAESYARRVRLAHGTAAIHTRLDGDGIAYSAMLDDGRDEDAVVAGIRRLFDLDADSATIDREIAREPALAPSVIRSPGVRLPGSIDLEETLFRTLVGQQVSVVAARTVLGRLSAELCGGSGLFPTASDFAERGEGVVRGPASRVASILRVAERLASGELVLDERISTAELTAALVAQPGIGPWTAGYVAMRVLGDPDVLLSSDLIMLRSAESLGLPSTARSLASYGERWAPWRSYAGLHLWRSANR